MSDEVDISNESQSVIMEAKIAYRIETPKLDPSGSCFYCQEPIEHPKLFCNGDCADDYDKYVTRKGL